MVIAARFIGVLAATGIAVACLAGPVGAETREVPSVGYHCAGGVVADVSLGLHSSSPDVVPEDGAALVDMALSFGPLGSLAAPGATVVRTELTFSLEDPVGDIDLQFGAGTISARDWDARGGQQVMVSFVPEQPVPVADASLPPITEIFTFDPASVGRRIAWRSFRTVTVTFDEGGVARVVTCQALDQQLSPVSTMIGPPVGPEPHNSVIKAADAKVRASASGTTGLPPGYDPVGTPIAPPTAPDLTTTSTKTGTANTAGTPGTSQAGSNGTEVGVSATGAPGDQTEVAAGAPVSDANNGPWTWAIIVLGLASAAAVVGIMVHGHREDRLGLGDPDDPS